MLVLFHGKHFQNLFPAVLNLFHGKHSRNSIPSTSPHFVSRETFDRFTTRGPFWLFCFTGNHSTNIHKISCLFCFTGNIFKSGHNSKCNLIHLDTFQLPTFNYKLCLLSVFKAVIAFRYVMIFQNTP